MDVILVDTSVWVNFFRAQETASTLFLKKNRDSITIAPCPVIVQEILQGIVSDKEYKSISSYFDSLLKIRGSHYLLAKDAPTYIDKYENGALRLESLMTV